VLVLRRDPVDHPHFRTPTALPVIGAVVSLGVMTTKDWATFTRAGILLAVGVAAWLVNWLAHERRARPIDDADLSDHTG
jgi:basic amino acid/polyamine antiporter, APA family